MARINFTRTIALVVFVVLSLYFLVNYATFLSVRHYVPFWWEPPAAAPAQQLSHIESMLMQAQARIKFLESENEKLRQNTLQHPLQTAFQSTLQPTSQPTFQPTLQPTFQTTSNSARNMSSFREGRQFDTKYEIPWGGVLPIPPAKTKVWIDIGTNINPIVAPSPNVYMILVDPIPNLVMNNAKAFPNPMDVAVVWSAISNTTGTALFNVYLKDGKASSLATALSFKASNVVEVPVHTLGELLNMIPKELEIELLKTDMQGYDLIGLKSARGSLKRVKMITSELLAEKGVKEYVGQDNSMTSASHYLKALGFSQLSCGKLDCAYQNAEMCKSSSSCTMFQHQQRICRQYTVIGDNNLAKCQKKSVTPFRAPGDKCTVCKPFR